jgi:chromosome segregation ATPase
MSFIAETDQNEEELRQLEEQELEAKFRLEKASKQLHDFQESGQEFELDEREVSVKDKMPTLRQQHQQLTIQKGQIEQNLEYTTQTLDTLTNELNSLKQEMESWKIQIVKSPEKIKKTQEITKLECQQVVSKNDELRKLRELQLNKTFNLDMLSKEVDNLVKLKHEIDAKKKDIQDDQKEVAKIKGEF